MADKEQQAYHPPQTNGYTRSNEATDRADAKAFRRQKHKKWLLYGVAFVVFQSAIIALFTLTIMKVRNPKFRVRSVTFETFDVPEANTSFNLRTNFQFGIKNTNFGPYKYDNSTIDFFHADRVVGSATIRKSKAQFRRTKKITIPVDLTLSKSDINSGILPLTSRSTLNGKVELMLIFKKKKSVNMNCTMDVNTSTLALQNVICK